MVTKGGASGGHPEPGAIVRRAYLAANRGRFAEANRYVASSALRSLRKTQARLGSSRIKVQPILHKVSPAAQRERLRDLLAGMGMFLDPNFCWKLTTRGGSIVSIEVLREVVRHNQAEVTVALRFKSDRVVKEKETLIRTRRGWLIGERGAPQNKRMQLTKPARAMELRS